MSIVSSPALIERGDPRWAAATATFDLTLTQAPALVALPSTAGDVVAVVELARERGLRVAPQRTGHNARPLGALDDAILLRTDAMQGVELDLERRVARVAAGARWADVVLLASDHGLAALHGALGDALAPWDSGRRYLNFTEERVSPSRFFTPEALARLRAVKALVDPDGVFRSNHPV